MGSVLSFCRSKKPPSRELTKEERDHLILLGTTAGGPGIIFDAIESGNIFDPAHMERATAHAAEWEQGISIIGAALERRTKIETLCQIGSKMDGTPAPMTYRQFKASVGDATPVYGWLLRVRACEHVADLPLGPSVEDLYDAVLTVSRALPRFDAWIVRPGSEPAKLSLNEE